MTSSKVRTPVPGETDVYPVLPLRDIVVFPHMIVPLFVGREKSIRALEAVMRLDKPIFWQPSSTRPMTIRRPRRSTRSARLRRSCNS